MQEKYNVGIYCRLSRDDERTGESVSIENQKIMLSRYVQEQGWNLYAAYCDDGVSGTTFDRPMFNQMIADARAGKINLILCKDLSRLGRDYIEAGRYSVRKRRFLHLWCVKFLKREAVLKNPTFSRFTHCKSVFSFALNNFISAFFACIFFVYTRFENTHEAIVDKETWELAQKLRKTPRRHDTIGEANPLTGLLFCAECGARMYNHRCGGRALREGWKPDADSGLYPSDNYNCSTYMLTAKHSEQKCCSHYITTRAVRALLLDTIKTVSTYAISDEKGFVEKIRTASQLRQDNAAKELKRKLNRDRKRSAELDGLIKKLYECESRVEQELGKSGSNAAKDMTKQARQGADQGGGLDVR